MASSAFSVTYKSVDIEVLPKHLVGAWPDSAIRLQLDGFAPAIFMVATAATYWFLLVKGLFPATRPNNEAAKQSVGRWRDAHNFSLFVFSALSCGSTAWWLISQNQIGSWEALMCTPVEGTWLRALSTAFTLSKIWEWGDTAFIVWLGSKPPEFLHLYHHAT